jgi:glyoxylase-like metal-dependent hydrolase (beta-lactamase superfamily II)
MRVAPAALLLFLSIFVVIGTPVYGEEDVPLLFPGSRNPMKKWEVEPISDGVYGFRYTFYRNVFIVTDDGVIVIDPLNAEAAGILREEIRKLTDQPVRYVAYTHSHWDHASGGEIFKEEGAEFIAQDECAEHFREAPNPDVVYPDVTYRDRYRISLGGKSLDMYYFGPSHDSCLVVMRIEPANMLFLVDIANPPDGWAMFYNPAVSEDRVWHMVPFFTRVQALIDEHDIETVIGGHMTMGINPETGRRGIVSGLMGPASVVAERRDFWQSIIAAVKVELAAGTPASEVPDSIVEQGILKDQISGYEPDQMRILARRITSYVQTGE